MESVNNIKEIICIRHGKTYQDKDSYFGRTHDSLLDLCELDTLKKLKNSIGNFFESSKIFSSKAIRCLDTGNYIFGKEPIIIEGLQAYHSGKLEDLTFEEVAQRYPDYLHKPVKQKFINPEYGEESIARQLARVSEGVDFILKTPMDRIVLIVHYSTLNTIGALLNNDCDPQKILSGKYHLDYGEAGVFRYDMKRNSWCFKAFIHEPVLQVVVE